MTMVKIPWMSKQARLDNLTEQYAGLMQELGRTQAQVGELFESRARIIEERDRLAGQLAQIMAALHEVSVYEGLVDVSPVAMMVSQLAHDHEELEARIDAVVMLLRDPSLEHTNEMIEIGRLLKGGKRVPDGIGE